jgi:hypothetical protein
MSNWVSGESQRDWYQFLDLDSSNSSTTSAGRDSQMNNSESRWMLRLALDIIMLELPKRGGLDGGAYQLFFGEPSHY